MKLEIKIEKITADLENEWKSLKSSQVFQSPEWSKFLAITNVITARDVDRKLIGIMPFKEKKFGLFKFVTAPSVPLVNSVRVKKDAFLEILNYFKKLGTFNIIETTYNDFNGMDYGAVGFSLLNKGTRVIPLDIPLEYIWGNLAGPDGKNHKKIKKAVKVGVKVIEADSKEQWTSFYEIYSTTGKEWNVPIINKYEFDLLRNSLATSNLAKLFIATVNDEIIAGLIILLSNEDVITFISANKIEKDELQGYSLILWNVLKYGWLNNFKKADFYGIDIYSGRNEKTYRITEFKESFGGYTKIYGKLSSSKLLKVTYDLYNRIRLIKLLYSKFKTYVKTRS